MQRPLWASTSTKNPAYSDILYVQELIGPDTVNTMPLNTMDAFRDHGSPAETVTVGVDEAAAHLDALETVGHRHGRGHRRSWSGRGCGRSPSRSRPCGRLWRRSGGVCSPA